MEVGQLIDKLQPSVSAAVPQTDANRWLFGSSFIEGNLPAQFLDFRNYFGVFANRYKTYGPTVNYNASGQNGQCQWPTRTVFIHG